MARLSIHDRQRRLIPAVIVGLVLVALMLAPAGCSSSSTSSDSSSETTAAAVLAPDFSGVTLDGEAVSLSDYQGGPLVLVFMASWCGPCRAESPEIEQFYQDNKDRAAVLAVAVNDTEEDIQAFVIEDGLSFPVMINNDSAVNAYGISGIPTTVVIDPEGHVVKRIVGGTTAETLSLIIDGITR